jgi:hypothetical protein
MRIGKFMQKNSCSLILTKARIKKNNYSTIALLSNKSFLNPAPSLAGAHRRAEEIFYFDNQCISLRLLNCSIVFISIPFFPA